MNSVGSHFQWGSRLCRIHALRLQSGVEQSVCPTDISGKFPLIRIRLKSCASFSNCCLPKSTSDLHILPCASLLVTKVLQPTSCLLLCSQEVIKTNLNEEWETPATGGVVAQWVYLLTVSLQLLQMNPSAFYAHALCWRNEPYESCLSQLALTWMRAVLAGECPRLQV